MNMITTKPFKSGNSEAIRLPKEMAFGIGTEIELTKLGSIVTIRPKSKPTIKEMVEALRAIGMPPDGVQVRELIEPPERQGL